MPVSKLQIKWKSIIHIHPNTSYCTLCCQLYDANTPITECQTCHQMLHSHCQLDWCITNILSESKPTCPFCRSTWKQNSHILYPIIEADRHAV